MTNCFDNSMVLVRALNDFDIMQDPLCNGIASKKLVYNLTKDFYEKTNDSHYLELSPLEKDLFIKEHILDYLENNKDNLENIYNKKLEDFMTYIDQFVSNGNIEQYLTLKKSLASLKEHVLQENNDYTNWISTSKDFPDIMKYYDGQDVHKVVVLSNSPKKLIGNDNTIMVDLTHAKNMPKAKFLRDKLYSKYVDFLSYLDNFPIVDIDSLNLDLISSLKMSTSDLSVNDYEVCFYQYLSRPHVLAVLEALQMDLVKLGLFDSSFLFLSSHEQLDALDELKGKLYQNIKKKDDSFLLYVFDELYVKNKNINMLKEDNSKLEYNRNKILELVKGIPNRQIKR